MSHTLAASALGLDGPIQYKAASSIPNLWISILLYFESLTCNYAGYAAKAEATGS